MTPQRRASGVSADDIRHGAIPHDGSRHAALLRRAPNGPVSETPLIVGVEPRGELADLFQVLYGANAAAEIADVNGLRIRFLRDAVPKTPDLRGPLHIDFVEFPIGGALRVGQGRGNAAGLFFVHFLAGGAETNFERAGTGPRVGEKSVGFVARIHLAVDGGHVFRVIVREHARPGEPGAFQADAGGAVGVTLNPFRMRVEGLLENVKGIHAGDDANIPLARGRGHFAEEITRAEIRAAMMEGNLGRIHGFDAAAVDEHGVNLQRGPVVHPGVRIDRQRVNLVVINLAAAPHGGVPRFRVRGICGLG